jgi:hypothetical protein
VEKAQTTRLGSLRYLHEFLFSLNIVFVGRLVRANSSSFPLETKLRFRINAYLHLDHHNNVGGYTALFAITLLLALCIFAVLRIFSKTLLVKEILLSVAGGVSLLALPTYCLYQTHLYGSPPGAPNPPHVLLLSELFAAMVYATLYLYTRRHIPAWESVSLLVLHFSLWGWLFLGIPYFWRAPLLSIFPLTGLCSCLVWGLYVSSQRRTTLPINHDP